MKFIIKRYLRLLLFLCLIVCSFTERVVAMNEQKIIYIYNGPGVSEESLQHTQYTLQLILDESYLIKTIEPKKVREGNWVNDAALFIMPGGADLPYLEHLGSLGNKKIKEFVKKGGSYLGFCAGAYYGSRKVEFALNSPLEIIGERELGFFAGKAIGPVLATYDYKTNSGARAALLEWRLETNFPFKKKFLVYYNGGGYFENPQYENVKILANYDIAGAPPKAAIIEILIEKGKVILSGVHCEYAPELLDNEDQYLSFIKKQLTPMDLDRRTLMETIIKRLGINLRKRS
jgi:glutamine amidotransferase-like uncharacterized protein